MNNVLVQNIYELYNEIKKSSLLKGGVGSFLIKFSDLFLKLILGIILARILGVENFGIYTFVYAIVSILTIPTKLGLPQLLIRYLADYEVKEDWGKIKGLIKVSSLTVTSLSIVTLLATLILINYKIIAIDTSKTPTFYWGLALIPTISLLALVGASLRGLRHIVFGLLPENFIRHFLFIIFLLCSSWWFLDGSLTSSIAMKYNFLASLIALLFGGYWLIRKVPKEVRSSETDYRITEWSYVALPLLLNGGMQIVMSRLDVVLLGWMGSAEQVGVYEVAWKGAALVSFGLGALNMLLGPYFSRYFNSKQYQRLQKLVTASVIVNLFIGLVIISAFIFFGEYILNFVFGEEYIVGYSSLIILAMAHLISVASGSVGLLLNMVGYEKTVLMGLSISAILNGVLNILLIPKFGIEGASFASLCTFLLWNTFLVFLSIKYINIDTSILSIFRSNKK